MKDPHCTIKEKICVHDAFDHHLKKKISKRSIILITLWQSPLPHHLHHHQKLHIIVCTYNFLLRFWNLIWKRGFKEAGRTREQKNFFKNMYKVEMTLQKKIDS